MGFFDGQRLDSKLKRSESTMWGESVDGFTKAPPEWRVRDLRRLQMLEQRAEERRERRRGGVEFVVPRRKSMMTAVEKREAAEKLRQADMTIEEQPSPMRRRGSIG